MFEDVETGHNIKPLFGYFIDVGSRQIKLDDKGRYRFLDEPQGNFASSGAVINDRGGGQGQDVGENGWVILAARAINLFRVELMIVADVLSPHILDSLI